MVSASGRGTTASRRQAEQVGGRGGGGAGAGVGDRGGAAGERDQVGAVNDAGRERVGGGAAGQVGHGKRSGGGGQDQVAEAAAAQYGRVGDQAGVQEKRAHRRHLGAGVHERRAVAHVGRVDPGRGERPGGRGHELHRGEVRGGAGPVEQVR